MYVSKKNAPNVKSRQFPLKSLKHLRLINYNFCPIYHQARLAQSVEHETLNLRVVGSSPTLGVHIFISFFWLQITPDRNILFSRDTEGNFFMDPVFNETVQIVEFDEGFDSEVFFMYVFLVAGLFLVLFLVYSLIGGSKGKKNVAVSKAMETGTTNDDVDYEWIPRSGNF